MRNVKIWGGALVAACLGAAILANTAVAAEFHSNAANASIKGTQLGSSVITVDGSTVTCTTNTLSGTGSASKTWTEQDLQPTFSGCTAFGFAGSTVNTTGCNFEVNSNSTNANLEDCTNGGMTIHVSAFFGTTTCHVFLPNQSGIGNWSWPTGDSTDTTSTIEVVASDVHYTVLASTGFCPLTDDETDDSGSFGFHFSLTANGGSATLWKE